MSKTGHGLYTVRDIESNRLTMSPSPPTRLNIALTLLATLAIGAVGALIFNALSWPLPWMLGSLTSTLIGSLLGFKPFIPMKLFTAMLLILGIYAGAALDPSLLFTVWHWPLSLIGMGVLVVATTAVNHWYFRRFAGFDKTTALFASVPGAQSLVLIMSARSGADEKQVLIPQITRVLAVIYFVPLILVGLGDWTGLDMDRIRGVPEEAWSLPDGLSILWLLVATGLGLLVARRLNWPQPLMIGPLAGVALMQITGLTDLNIPGQALVPVQFVLGTYLGTKFARIRWRTAIILSGHGIVALALTVVLVALMTLLLTLVTDIPPAAIFLAFAPGGLPEMVLIAATLNADPAFVVIHHVVRFLIIAIALPWVADKITTGVR
ncbi:AbrB family transcriptional regulator [Saccharospirillum impatiens]|uniref:AbrB family transcriptional regulator n=1 Tax=Saccharospirillum impatiens TaxID=169438 RepID=UPI000411CEFA|nr:AbrB family transcriptional regulator [Saccharospirillum impatiens]